MHIKSRDTAKMLRRIGKFFENGRAVCIAEREKPLLTKYLGFHNVIRYTKTFPLSFISKK